MESLISDKMPPTAKSSEIPNVPCSSNIPSETNKNISMVN